MTKTEFSGRTIARGYRIAIVVSRFNDLISKELLRGALLELDRHTEKECDVRIYWVPGSFEVAGTVARLLEKGEFDGILALGCLIQGETDHYRLLATEITKGLSNLSIKNSIPIGFGVLTVSSLEDALERAGTKAGNKGGEAMVSLLEMIDLYKKIREK